MKKLITTKLLPKDINVDKSFMASKWQNLETEAAAKWLCKFAQSRGNWNDFTKKDIDKFSKHDFWFNKLTEQGDIVRNQKFVLENIEPYMKGSTGFMYTQKVTEFTESYSFTDSFIIACYNLTN